MTLENLPHRWIGTGGGLQRNPTLEEWSGGISLSAWQHSESLLPPSVALSKSRTMINVK